MFEQLAANTESPRGGTHVQIFKIQPWLTEKRRERREKQRVPDSRAIEAGDHSLDDRTLTKQGGMHVVLGRNHLVRQLLVGGELLNEGQNQRHILRRGRPDRYICQNRLPDFPTPPTPRFIPSGY